MRSDSCRSSTTANKEPTFDELLAEAGANLAHGGKDQQQPESGWVLSRMPLAEVAFTAETGESSYMNPHVSEKQLRQLGRETCQHKFDYHGLSRQQCYEQLDKDLAQSLSGGLRTIELVPGKGTGVLRRSILGWLRSCSFVAAYTHPQDNPGSVKVLLKNKQQP